MLFNSLEFAIFFAVTVGAYFALPARMRWVWLLVMSYVFYMSWEPTYALLLLASTCIDFVCGNVIAKAAEQRHRKAALLASVFANLGVLFTFKYWNFAQEVMVDAANVLGLTYTPSGLELLLPVGISFYTFQTMSYTIDIYRRKLDPEPNIFRFGLYVVFFPQLVAGPIERAVHLVPQLRTTPPFDYARVCSGLQLMAWGLFKKVAVGDRLGIYVDAVYNNPTEHGGLTFWLATYAFALQIYCDFSGYTDMAIGAARVLGFDLLKNFDRPYFSKTIVEFWRRWHISLSSWLRDYLYISLGGNRRGEWFTYRNLLITMVLGGIWHGASWNFVIWGTLQGVMLAVSRASLPMRDAFWARTPMPAWVLNTFRRLVTFHLVCLSWIIFRAATLQDTITITTGLFDLSHKLFLDIPVLAQGIAMAAVLVVVELAQARLAQRGKGSLREAIATLALPVRWALWLALILAIILFGVQHGSQFIYFQF